MFLKSDFMAALENAVVLRPAVATAYRAGDPRLIAQIEAMATMLSMVSAQIDAAEVEPFTKGRIGTVMADASLKGVLPLARPGRVSLTVTSAAAAAVAIIAGRMLVDGKGRRYVVDAGATVPAGGSATITASQLTTRTVTHTVSASVPFYSAQVPESVDGLFLAGIEVSDPGGAYAYTPEFCNIAAGARIFHAETDEFRRLFLRFGASDALGAVVGYQPPAGTVLTMTVRECTGAVELSTAAAFALEYVGSTDEGNLSLNLASLLTAGSNPPDVDTLRMLARYPALHDSNAVFLSNFDFLLRRQITGIEFLSIWNEQVEESVRGASVANINTLFVSISVPSQSDAVTQAQVRAVIGKADDSYRVTFKPMILRPQPVQVIARVAAVHDTADVAAQIKSRLLALYGRGTVTAAQGLARTLRIQAIHDDLRRSIPALQDQISDFNISTEEVAQGSGESGVIDPLLPENFRFFDAANTVVIVTGAQANLGLFGL